MNILDIIKDRWSPRAFSDRPVSNEQIAILLEAARWAPSSMNEQPWAYFYALKGEPGFEKMLECLVPGNRTWAKKAGAMILSTSIRKFKYNSKQNRHALHDLGAANALLAVQATALGMQAHQMGGFSMQNTLSTFDLDSEEYEPASFIAVGYAGNPELLPDDLRKRELAPRLRNPREEMAKHFA